MINLLLHCKTPQICVIIQGVIYRVQFRSKLLRYGSTRFYGKACRPVGLCPDYEYKRLAVYC